MVKAARATGSAQSWVAEGLTDLAGRKARASPSWTFCWSTKRGRPAESLQPPEAASTTSRLDVESYERRESFNPCRLLLFVR
jgi:hypothetical protein